MMLKANNTAEGFNDGEPFSINVSGPKFSYSNSGTLTSGNVQVQSQ